MILGFSEALSLDPNMVEAYRPRGGALIFGVSQFVSGDVKQQQAYDRAITDLMRPIDEPLPARGRRAWMASHFFGVKRLQDIVRLYRLAVFVVHRNFGEGVRLFSSVYFEGGIRRLAPQI
jgi:hypothetical protein